MSRRLAGEVQIPKAYSCVEVCEMKFADSVYYAYAGSISETEITATCNGDK